ncbi:HAD family hydrolase [Paracidovorax wautersii]|uniref:HAD family hydrolase n=1 Tax=Paracidovorax wautersii TaxID=1177982 RepID=UPI001587D43D|nr:HAD family hydrolase [Paracidovorax wautersii]
MSRNPTVALVDADNTLWDTDAVFRDAQLLLLSLVEKQTQSKCTDADRLSFIRAYDQALAQRHHLHLRYPPQLLVRSVEAGLAGHSPEAASQQAIAGQLTLSVLVNQVAVDAIVAQYQRALSSNPQLLQGVVDGVCTAKAAGLRLFVMTEGRVERQKTLLDFHGLTESFDGVWEMTKEQSQFGRIVARFSESQVVVVGDQPDRDIVPAKAAGCSTVLVPSRFKPAWQKDGDHGAVDYLAMDFLDAVKWCIGIDRDESIAAQ